jgi:HD-like signal output (HDOD) protein
MATKPRVLLLEENSGTLAKLKVEFSALTAYWDIDYFGSAIEAVKQVLEGPRYEVVVIDIGLESEDPVKVLSAIAERFPHTIRFALTDRADDQRIAKTASLAHQFVYSPCEYHTLRFQVSRAIALREKLRTCPLRQKLHEINALPPLPMLYREVMKEIHSADPSVARVAEIISKDVAMSAKLLQVVNSAGVGLRNEVTSVAQAASLLGLQRISAMILIVEVFNLVAASDLPAGMSLDRLWDHSLKVGEYAKIIAQCETNDARSIESAFTSGLLHDLGILLIASNFADQLVESISLAKSKKTSLLEAELEVMGATHAEVGGYLLELWGLPDGIVEAIAFHDFPSHLPEHDYESTGADLQFPPLLAVHVANYFCEESQKAHYGCPECELDQEYLESAACMDKVEFWWEQCTEEPLSRR